MLDCGVPGIRMVWYMDQWKITKDMDWWMWYSVSKLGVAHLLEDYGEVDGHLKVA